MNNLDNPYSSLIEIFRQEGAKYNSPDLMLGEVLTEMPNLTIKVGGVQLDKDNLYIADYLLEGYKREFKTESVKANISGGTVNGGTTSAYVSEHGSHSHTVNSINITNATHKEEGEITLTDTSLKKGDIVALQQLKGTNQFIVYCKLIRL